MAWGRFEDQGRGGGKRNTDGYVTTGNARIFLITETPALCRFLTEDVSVEDIMQQYGIMREEANDKLLSEISAQRWIMPKPFWEHTIPKTNDRFFSKSVCWGRGCPMCDENRPHRENGVENKNLPFPISKQYFAPAYFYGLNMVLFLKQSETFFNEIARYIDKYSSNSDFEIYSEGRQLNKRYRSTYMGTSRLTYQAIMEAGHGSTYPKPSELSPVDSPEEYRAKVSGGNRGSYGAPPPQAAPAPSPAFQRPPEAPKPVEVPRTQGVPAPVQREASPKAPPPPPPVNSAAPPPSASGGGAGDYVIQFGVEKGKTLQNIFDEGKGNIIAFYAKNTTGDIKAAATEFATAKGLL